MKYGLKGHISKKPHIDELYEKWYNLYNYVKGGINMEERQKQIQQDLIDRFGIEVPLDKCKNYAKVYADLLHRATINSIKIVNRDLLEKTVGNEEDFYKALENGEKIKNLVLKRFYFGYLLPSEREKEEIQVKEAEQPKIRENARQGKESLAAKRKQEQEDRAWKEQETEKQKREEERIWKEEVRLWEEQEDIEAKKKQEQDDKEWEAAKKAWYEEEKALIEEQKALLEEERIRQEEEDKAWKEQEALEAKQKQEEEDKAWKEQEELKEQQEEENKAWQEKETLEAKQKQEEEDKAWKEQEELKEQQEEENKAWQEKESLEAKQKQEEEDKAWKEQEELKKQQEEENKAWQEKETLEAKQKQEEEDKAWEEQEELKREEEEKQKCEEEEYIPLHMRPDWKMTSVEELEVKAGIRSEQDPDYLMLTGRNKIDSEKVESEGTIQKWKNRFCNWHQTATHENKKDKFSTLKKFHKIISDKVKRKEKEDPKEH